MQAEHLTEEDIAFFKKKLLDMKKEAETHTESDINQDDELASVNNHPADLGTEQFEQQRDAGLDQMRKEELTEVEDALQRIEDGTYGISEKSGKAIPKERLEASPAARILVEEASDTD
ncbi:TraR/DksA C4-type zinc finger protein [Oceanobacillus jeddahense]|uniref:DksA C4-type domain-containing protein n=1 Tax=Oceanobacillus jeddahense TaxID=1462527 RepID=A0ABY5JNM1_9BACI|nr:hypothetical protein [Oceanobacillus jeddahense]UUI01911.1 hypothetical protein NP439_17935 [Oceanobacillus jeddahense]